ncbi:immunity 22 family protein [Ralstonia solanacearum]|uniref:Immunity protein 22 n=1 Tax=Ralstonia solanacearum TaxID=305 RepID=A0AAD0WIH9_RALSL|nr:immunity 22 family protein [Ralstonia solanacearum]AXV84198.1 hypothetical protein CJO77_22025 [Ralstonia solanacearum]AXW55327.1 hypothetical protein CJO92_22035 [Ralstonia solanacearum]CBM10588.1 protein of unknown function [Ralstonia solanacearum PSI07]
MIDMGKDLKVSIWVGEFSDLDDLLQYVDVRYDDAGNLSNDFWRDIGIDWFDDDFREAALIDGRDLREEISEFSYGSSFADEVARDIGSDRKEGGSGIIMLYDFDYSARGCGGRSGRVRFVGSYDYRK